MEQSLEARKLVNKDIKLAKDWDNADLIIEYLKLLEVEFVFGVPGGAIEAFYNALARNERTGGFYT